MLRTHFQKPSSLGATLLFSSSARDMHTIVMNTIGCAFSGDVLFGHSFGLLTGMQRYDWRRRGGGDDDARWPSGERSDDDAR